MIFKNTIKLSTSNFSTVWKLLVYKLIVVALVAGLFCTGLGYIKSLGAYDDFANSFISFLSTANLAYTPSEIAISFLNCVNLMFAVIASLVVTFPILFAFYVVLFAIILPYLWHLSDMAVTENLFGYMSSLTKYGFLGSLIRNLRQANGYSLSITALVLPLNAIFFGVIYGLLVLMQVGGIMLYIAPCIIILWSLFYYSLRSAILPCWAGAMTTTNCNAVKGLKRGLKAVGRNFLKIWSNALVINFVFIALIMLTGALGFIVLTPLFCFAISVYGMVVYFENQGMRYYVDFDNIITPKKLEQTDKIKDLKLIV